MIQIDGHKMLHRTYTQRVYCQCGIRPKDGEVKQGLCEVCCPKPVSGEVIAVRIAAAMLIGAAIVVGTIVYLRG